MKIRTDFVTNSSSSNFIFAFNSMKEFNEFVEYCEEYDYQMIAELVKDLIKSSDDVYDKFGVFRKDAQTDESLTDMKNKAYHMLSVDIKHDMIAETLSDYKFDDFKEELKMRNKILSSAGFNQELLEKVREVTKWNEIETKLDKSELIVYGTIWDTSGGLMEWSIRNGLLEQEFRKWCLLTLSIG